MRIFSAGRSMARNTFALFIIGLAVLSGCANTLQEHASQAPIQSPNDERAYRLLTLDNGLKALLISDPDTPKAAASMDVHVGSGDNPPGRGGLAHFLEHMLFLGTEKYPDAAEYERYITEHGGSRNAYTSFEHTNYFFDIDAPHLEAALDRFAQFFVAPNFDARYVERERNAVQAEYQMGLKSDGRRGLDVLQASMNPEHPFSQFAVGDLNSLADRPGSPVRDELIAFYERYYTAEVMRLVVLGTESLDELQALVNARFAAVPTRAQESREITEPMFSDTQLPMLLKVEPLGTLRQLEVHFPMRDYRGEYDAKPMAYVSNLVGHEGAGSLLSQLKREGLAEGLYAGAGLAWRGGSLFSVTVSLTEQGVEQYTRVLSLLFGYLDMLRDAGPVERIYQEQAAVAQLAFRFSETRAPINYVSALSSGMQYYSDADVLRGARLMQRFDAGLISEALDDLRPQRAQIVLTAPGVETDRRSPFYDVPYALFGPEAVVTSQWAGGEAEDSLRLPAPNPFIPDNVDLLPVAEDNPEVPALRLDEPGKRVWYRQATKFQVPRGALYVSFRSPAVGNTAAEVAAAALYTRIVSDALNEEYTYPALLAGLGFDFYRHAQGISLRIDGYSDKQLSLLNSLLKAIAAQRFDPARFERIRRDMILELQNVVARRPSSQLMDSLRRALLSGVFSEEALIEELQSMEMESLQAYRESFWKSARSEALVYGNHPAAAVDQLAAELDQVLGDGAGEAATVPRVLALAANESLLLEAAIEHDDAVVGWYLQGSEQSLRERAAIALTAQVMESGFFQQLRTEQQLGYIVSSFPWRQYDVPGLMLLVQSPSHDAAAVHEAMVTFVQRTADDVTEAQFQRLREALVNSILKPHKNLRERAGFYWSAISLRHWDFDQREALVAAVRDWEFEEWRAHYRAQILENPRSLLAVSPGARGVLPKSATAEDSAVLRFSDPAAMRVDHPLYTPALAPF